MSSRKKSSKSSSKKKQQPTINPQSSLLEALRQSLQQPSKTTNQSHLLPSILENLLKKNQEQLKVLLEQWSSQPIIIERTITTMVLSQIAPLTQAMISLFASDSNNLFVFPWLQQIMKHRSDKISDETIEELHKISQNISERQSLVKLSGKLSLVLQE